jgi:hypothetical protein
MKSKSSILAGAISLVAGIILIVCNKLINDSGIVTTGGILFVLAAVINAVLYLNNRESEGKARRGTLTLIFGWIGCAAALLLGVAMLIFGEQFMTLIPYVFGLLIFFGALIQFYTLAIGVRPYILPGWLYLFPVLILAGALLVAFVIEAENLRLIITGVSMALFGLAIFVESFALSHAVKAGKSALTTKTDDTREVTDVQPVE